MKLPVIIIMFLPKKWQEKQIKLHWNSFTDEEILKAYKEDVEWINALHGLYGNKPSPIIDKYKKHLSEKVIPQMNKRGLTA